VTAIVESDGGGAGKTLGTPLVDVTRLSVRSLLDVNNSALALCLQRLLHDLEDPDGVISAFANVP
jgi:hypothetical protein